MSKSLRCKVPLAKKWKYYNNFFFPLKPYVNFGNINMGGYHTWTSHPVLEGFTINCLQPGPWQQTLKLWQILSLLVPADQLSLPPEGSARAY